MHNNRLGPKPPLDLNPTLSLLVYSFVSLERHSEADFLFSLEDIPSMRYLTMILQVTAWSLSLILSCVMLLYEYLTTIRMSYE